MASTQYSLFGKKYLVLSYSLCRILQILSYIGENKNEKSSFHNPEPSPNFVLVPNFFCKQTLSTEQCRLFATE